MESQESERIRSQGLEVLALLFVACLLLFLVTISIPTPPGAKDLQQKRDDDDMERNATATAPLQPDAAVKRRLGEGGSPDPV